MQQWATALVGYRGLRSDLLIELKKAQPLTAKELGARFGLTANALRRHLKELEAAGLVHYRREVRGVGGPRYAYSLSEDGEALFPRAHASALIAALEFVREREGPDAVVAFFRRRWAAIVDQAGLELGGLALEDRTQLLAELLTSQGYMAESHAEAGGGTVLRKYNCALREVAERFPELCTAEVSFMEDVLGARLDRRAHLLAGCNRCEYRVVEEPGGPSNTGPSNSGPSNSGPSNNGRGKMEEGSTTTPSASSPLPSSLFRGSGVRGSGESARPRTPPDMQHATPHDTDPDPLVLQEKS